MGYEMTECVCKYKEAFNNNHTPMMIIDPSTGKIDDGNLAACNYYGYSIKELLSMNIWDINILSQKDIFEEMNKAKLEDRKLFRFKHKLANGQIKDVEVYSGPININNKDLLLSAIHDMDEKIRLESKYLKNKVFFDSLFNNSPEAIAIVDENFKIININKSFKKIFQYDLKEIGNKDITNLLCEETLYDTSYYFRESITNGKFVKEEVRRKKKDETTIDVLLLGFPLVINGQTIGAYCIYSDISEIKEKEKKIKNLVYKDTSTGLYNKVFFLNNLEYEISKRRSDKYNIGRFAILTLNLNEFKEIKDALGHLTGEKILKEFANKLKNSVELEDIVARFNEDEFSVYISDVKDISHLRGKVDKIKDNLRDYIYIDNNEIQITSSMGISLYPDDGTEAIGLVGKAYIAMNKSKEINLNNPIRFEYSLEKEVQEHFLIKNDLIKAIANNELYLNYQPIYDTRTNKLIGVEALIRWAHREKGIIPPTKFIPIAEETGIINKIGEWVLINACKQNKKLQDTGYKHIYVSVNISVVQLEQPDFGEKVIKILRESKLNPKYLQLEITETFFNKNYGLIQRAIMELSEIGVRFAIDDFGTGYSSLEQLCQLNINNLKIDRIFIDGVDNNMNKSKIVKAVISLADSLNIGLTAEGVETEEQLEFLKQNGCTFAQGFLFSKPINISEIEELLKVSD